MRIQIGSSYEAKDMELPTGVVLTDNGTEFCGTPESRCYGVI